MAVQMHRPRPSTRFGTSEPTSTLYIGNMSYMMTDRDLNSLFRPLRNVTDVRVAIDRRTGQPRGFAHADFTDEESAVAARTELQGKLVYGRNLRVEYAVESPQSVRNKTSKQSDAGPSSSPGETPVGVLEH
jgi:nucleolin